MNKIHEFEKEVNEKVYRFHKFGVASVDFSSKKIKVEVKSWGSFQDAQADLGNYAKSIATKEFDDYDYKMALNAHEEIQSYEWASVT